MEDIAGRLADLGYRRARAEPECWQVTRIGSPVPSAPGADPVLSRLLAGWRRRLGARVPPSPYQVCLAFHIAAAGRITALD
jgi:hypothetical protein